MSNKLRVLDRTCEHQPQPYGMDRHKVTSQLSLRSDRSYLRQTLPNDQDVFQRTDIGAGRSRRIDRCVRANSFCLPGSWLTCDSAEWPRVLENVLQRLHQVSTQPLLASLN
jgi:hypothetical protein